MHVAKLTQAAKEQARVEEAHRMFKQVQELLKNPETGDLEKALSLLSDCIDLRPAYPRYFFTRGNCYRLLNVPQLALWDYSMSIKMGKERDPAKHSNRGIVLRMLGRVEDALQDFEQAISLRPSEGKFYYNRGLVYTDMGEFEKAIADFSTALQYMEGQTGEMARVGRFKAYFNRGNCHRSLSNLSLSLSDLQEAVKLDMKSSEAYNNLGKTYFDRREYEEASKRFTAAIDLDRTNPDFYNNRGLAYYRMGDMENARKDYDMALEMYDAYKREKEEKEEIEVEVQYRRETEYRSGMASPMTPGSPYTPLSRTQSSSGSPMAKSSGSLSPSPVRKSATSSSLHTKPRTPQSLLRKATHSAANLSLSPSRAANLSLSPSLSASPKTPISKLLKTPQQSHSAPDLSRTSSGVSYVPPLRAVAVTAAEIFFNRGNCLRQLNEYQASLRSLDEALILEPDEPLFHHCKGLTYASMGSGYTHSALRAFKSALRIQHDYVPSLYHMGVELHKAKQYFEALEYLTKAIKFFEEGGKRTFSPQKIPIDDHFHEGVGIYDPERERENEGERERENAGEKEGEKEEEEGEGDEENPLQGTYADLGDEMAINPRLYQARGCLYKDLLYFDLAIEDLSISLSADPRNGELYYHRGHAYYAQGDYTHAMHDLRTSIETCAYKHPRVYNLRALVKLKLQRPEDAIRDFSVAVRTEPDSLEYMLNRSKCFAALGRYVDCIRDCTKLLERYSMLQRQRERERVEREGEKGEDPAKGSLHRSSLPPSLPHLQSYSSLDASLRESSEEPMRESEALYTRGLAHYRLGKWKSCVKDLLAAVDSESTYLQHQQLSHTQISGDSVPLDECFYFIALSYVYLGFAENALTYFSKAISHNDLEPLYLHERAKCLQDLQRYAEAVDDFDRVVQMQPHNANAVLRRGFAYKAMRRFDDAAADFELAKSLEPENPNLVFNYTKLYEMDSIELVPPGEEPE